MTEISKVIVPPGIDTQNTPMLNEGRFSLGNLIRFFQGKAQKIGGWTKYMGTAIHDTCRGIFTWQDLNSQSYVVAGTNDALQLVYQNAIYDITPLLSTKNLANPFTTISGTNTLTVHDVAHGELVSDAIYIVTETSINGKLLIGYYDVSSVTDADNYVISTGSTFSASVAGATTALFSTTNTSPTVQVTLTNHGRVAGQFYTVNVSTAVGGLTLVGDYLVASVIDANNFTFNAGANATSTTTANENAGNIRINYLMHAGLTSSTALGGYGIGGYGTGTYGIGTVATTLTPLRQWFFGNWGKILIANPSGGSIYLWDPTSGVTSNHATAIGTAPTANSMFIAMPSRQVVALGVNGDPLNIMWSEVDNYTIWIPASTNQAGSYRLPRGTKIVGGIQAPQMGMIWTDLGVWAMQYIQSPLIYGFTEIGTNCGLIAARAVGILNGKVYWMSNNNFFVYNGSVEAIPCAVWDRVFMNLNSEQADKITCAVNSEFNEIFWFYPSATGNGENDLYVKYNAEENVWDYGSLSRTAWLDRTVISNPLGVGSDSYIYQHEVGNNADSSAMDSYIQTGWFKITDGLMYLFIERMIPDFVLSNGASITITISTVDYPNDTPRTKSFTVTSGTEYSVIRLRGRLASIKVESTDLNSFWRLGELLYLGTVAGRR